MPDSWEQLLEKYAQGVPPEKLAEFKRLVDQKSETRFEDMQKALEDFKSSASTAVGMEALFKGAFASVIGDLKIAFPEMLRKGFETVAKAFQDSQVNMAEADLDGFVRDGVLSEDAKATMLALVKRKPILGTVAVAFMGVTNYLTQVKQMFEASHSESFQRVNAAFHPNLFGPGDIIRACFTSPGDTPTVRALLERLGYKPEHIDLYLKAHYATYTIDEAFRLYLRGKLTDSELVERCRENGFTDDRIKELRELYNVVPPISDILMLLGKEAFEEDQVRKFGLDDEYPGVADEYGAMHGLSRDWVKRYWRAHWNPPSPGQVLEMLHRQLITEADVYEYYRVVEMPPYWREKLMKISYSPYARVDTRRMYQLGILDQAAVYKAYRDEGYDHEHAVNLTRFTVAYSEAAEKDLTVSEVMSAYKIGVISPSSCRDWLLAAGFSEAEADFKIGYVDYAKDVKERDEAVGIVGEQFKAGLIEEDAAREALRKILFDESEVDRYIAKWSVSYAKTRRHPTKSELDKFLYYGIISAEQYVYELGKLGYSDKHIGWFLDLALAEIQGA